MLIKFPNRVFSDEEIINSVWVDSEKNISSYSLKNLIKNLRKKLPCDIIENYYGVGYKLISHSKMIQNKIDFIDGIKTITTIIEKAKSSKELIKNVIDTTLEIFDCDRVFLLYPLDSQVKTFEILYEATKEEYPGAVEFNTQIDMTNEQIEFFEKVLNSKEPLSIPKNRLENVKSYSKNLAQIKFIPPKSNLVWKIKPVIGKLWGIGLHQCSYERIWNENEIELFKDIALRLRDALSILLFNEENSLDSNYVQKYGLNSEIEEIQNFFMENRKIDIANELINNISHQLYQPFTILSLVIGRVELKLKQLGIDDRELLDSISLMDNEIKEMKKSIKEFDNFFKHKNQKEIFYVSKAILEVKSLIFDSFLNDRIEFNIDIKDDYKIESYLNDFRQVIYYILINTKQLLLNSNKTKRVIKITLEKKDKNFLIKISDTNSFNKEIANKYQVNTFSKKLDEISIYLSKVVIEKNLNGEFFINNSSDNIEFIIKIKGE